ncbi:MAG: hypothetical protein ACT4O1_10205 [Gemmatimonadota bacterium]
MNRDRHNMTVRIVPLHSQEAGDARVGGSMAERLALVAELSRRGWTLAGKPTPAYTRDAMPFRLTTLDEQ